MSNVVPIYCLTIQARSPLAPLKKGGDRSVLKVPLLKGDLGGSSLGDKQEIQRISDLRYLQTPMSATKLIFGKFPKYCV